jgi:hypothetical protein
MGARQALPALILAAGVVLAGCGGDDDSGGGNPLAAGTGDTADDVQQAGGTTAPPADASGGGGGGAATGEVPDACGLLTAEEVGQVVPGATATGPTTSANGPITISECAWDSPSGQLNVSVTAGIPPDQLQLSIETEASDFGGRAVDIGGDDDAQVFSAIQAGADVKGVVNGMALAVSMVASNASSQQDALVDLARTAAGRF